MPYDARGLAAALTTLSMADIQTMLLHIAALEAQLTKLDAAGQDDAMLRRVTDSLRLLTYLLDAVQRHKEDTGDSR
ncbi:MAG: hypothetical protein HZC41_19710 [Chloroflexi bacterium]|nr:hypothetical protein [Chloroflexota bacterium]